MHDDQLSLDADVARRLIVDQFPQWKDLDVRELRSAATVNAIFRLGDDLTARFPLLAEDPAKARTRLTAEAAAAQEFADVSTVSAPRPVAIGEPGHGYPMPWSVQTWVSGADATGFEPGGSVEFAQDLATLILRLRRTPTRGRRFAGERRGGHLPDHDEWMAHCFTQSEELLDVTPLRAMWADLRTLPAADADAMCHGDLIPPNVLVRDGRLVGVIDTGGFGPADPALELVCAWHLLDAGPREALRAMVACDDLQWRRGMAWALQQAMGLIWYYAVSNPTMSRWGRRTLDRLVEQRHR